MTAIPDAAVEAAAEAMLTFWSPLPDPTGIMWTGLDESDKEQLRAEARVAVEAAMPAIREAIAQEIEDSHRSGISRGSVIRLGALADAARIVRGGTP